MKTLTPIEKIIEFINESAGQMPLEGVLDYAKILLKEEKQVIVDAYNTAQKEIVEIVACVFPIPETVKAIQDVLNGHDNEDAIEYYNNKYTK